MHAIVLYRQSTCEHNAQITYKAVHLQVPCIRHIWVVKKVPCVGISAGERRLAKTLNFSDTHFVCVSVESNAMLINQHRNNPVVSIN